MCFQLQQENKLDGNSFIGNSLHKFKKEKNIDLDSSAVTVLPRNVNGKEEHDGQDKNLKQMLEILMQLKKGR